MKKLFIVKDSTTGKQYGDECFGDKKQAKNVRKALNETDPDRYVVSYGPDHHKHPANRA